MDNIASSMLETEIMVLNNVTTNPMIFTVDQDYYIFWNDNVQNISLYTF